jgi:hypothetical protein
MFRNSTSFSPSGFALALVLFAAAASVPSPALAAAQRTFVASTGLPGNPCSLGLPCRTFDEAISQTVPGGEVVILDTAGYGAMTIDRAIKVVGPSGVYGGVSVFAGAGITINAGDTDTVTLRGLDIVGIGALPVYGIDIQNAGVVHVERTSINNFSQDTSACINVSSAKPVQVYVNDSFLRECRNGISATGSGPDDSSRISLVVDNTRIEHNVNTAATGTIAVKVNDGVVASIRNSVLAYAGDGIRAFNTVAGVGLRVEVVLAQITRMGNAAVETGGSAGSVHVDMVSSVINNNGAALLNGRGLGFLTSNLITHNTHSLVDCGAGAASVTSLGYSGGNGSNSFMNNTDGGVPGGCTAYITPTQIQGK